MAFQNQQPQGGYAPQGQQNQYPQQPQGYAPQGQQQGYVAPQPQQGYAAPQGQQNQQYAAPQGQAQGPQNGGQYPPRNTFVRNYGVLQAQDGTIYMVVAFAEFATAKEIRQTQSGKNALNLSLWIGGQSQLLVPVFGQFVQPNQAGDYLVNLTLWGKDAEKVNGEAQKHPKRRVRLNVTGELKVNTWADRQTGEMHANLELTNVWLGAVTPVNSNGNDGGGQYAGYAPQQQTQAQGGGYAPQQQAQAQGGYAPQQQPQSGYAAPQGQNQVQQPQSGYAAPQGQQSYQPQQPQQPQGQNQAVQAQGQLQGQLQQQFQQAAPQGPTGNFAVIDDDDGGLPF